MKFDLPAARLSQTFIFIMLASLCLAAPLGCGGESRLSSSLDDAGNNDGGNNGGQDTDVPGADTGVDTWTDEDTGGDTDTGPSDPCLETTPQQAATFADDYATALCNRLFSCGANPQVAQYVSFGGWSSVERCVESVRAGTISAGQAQAGATEGSLTLNSCKATECLNLLPTLDCVGIHRALSEARYDQMTACYDAWSGTLATGQTCTVDAQCEGEQVCARDDASNTCAGTCTPAGQSGSGQCGDIVCAADQYCQPDNNICITRSGAGESCQADYECSMDTYCNAGQCTAISTGRTDGQSCNGQTEVCSLDYGCIGGQCTSFLAEGESCQLFGCEGNLFCNQNGVCEARGATGSGCQSDQQCQSLRCAGGTCTSPDALCP